MSKMIVIKDKDLCIIKELAQSEFKKRPSFGSLDTQEIQYFCMFSALEGYLRTKGVEVPFSMEGFVQEDSSPVDESGQGENG